MSVSETFVTEVVDGRHLNVTAPGKPGRILITLGDEGFNVELYPELAEEPIVGTGATYQELKLGEEP